MKKYQKLAQDYLISREGYDDYYENGYCQNNYEDMREAYAAGFLKAHELHMAFHEKEYDEGRELYDKKSLDKILEEEVDE